MSYVNVYRPQTTNESKLTLTSDTSRLNETKWKGQVINDMKLNNDLIDRSDRNIFFGKSEDPLTNLREVLRTLSNREAFKYMRQCRLIVAKLKKCWLDVNEEVKSLSKNKEYVESAIEHIRKDIIINNEIADGRIHRPYHEPGQDNVDDSLAIEKRNLLTLKRNLELMLKSIQEEIFRLDNIREKVFKFCRERSTVTDLICQCLSQSIRSYDKTVALNKGKSAILNSPLSKSHPNLKISDRYETESLSELNITADLSSSVQVGPLNAFTEESLEIMRIAAREMDDSKDLRMRSLMLIRDSIEMAKKNSKFVDDAFARKIAEQLNLTQNLAVGSAENALAQNRASRWQELSEVALNYSLGPEKSTNLQTYEQINRPIIRSYQKHPGNQVPEVSTLIQGSQSLSKSVNSTVKHLKALKVIGQKLDSNIKDKEYQYKLDSSLLRRRRELSGHRWTPIKYVK